MHAAYDTAVKRFICEFVAVIILILHRPNAAVNRFGFGQIEIVGNRLIVAIDGGGGGLVSRRRGPIVHLIDAIRIDDRRDVPVPIAVVVNMMMIIFVNVIIVNGMVMVVVVVLVSAVQMLIYVIQFAD